MKFLHNVLTGFLLILLSNNALSQPNVDTLKHFTFDQDFASPESTDGDEPWGFIFGHSNLGYNQFAEKFYFRGDGVQVESMIAYVNARAIEFPELDSASFVIYESEGNQPGQELHEKSRALQDLRYGHPKVSDATVINFEQPVPVEDSFYTSFELAGSPTYSFRQGDTIGLWVLENGERSSSEVEQSITARNVVQGINASGWKAVDEALGWQTHFALAPVITFTRTSSTGERAYGQKAHLKVFPPFPNPASEHVMLEYQLQQPAETVIKISNLRGTTQLTKNLGKQGVGGHETPLNVSKLSPGSYLVTIYAGSAMVTTKITVR